jgi:foldase protein PrsA
MPSKRKTSAQKRVAFSNPLKNNTKIVYLAVLTIILALSINILFKNTFIASVNGKFITRLELIKELESKNGKSVLNDIVTKEIIFQEAKNKGIKVTENDINNVLEGISANVSQQGSSLSEVLTMQGMTLAELKENIKIQRILEQILADKVSVTDEEVNARYEQDKATYDKSQDVAKIKLSIKDQISQEKLSTAYNTWILEKRASAKIRYFLNYE